MNEMFSEEQVEVYAAAFREGDAVKVDDRWHEVIEDKEHVPFRSVGHQVNTSEENIVCRLNYFDNDFKGVVDGFKSTKPPYIITTPKDYEVQEGDKLVWLGETQKQGEQHMLTFGQIYDVVKGSKGDWLVYKNDMYTSILARSVKHRWKFWGVIPRWKNVKGDKEMMGDGLKCNAGNKAPSPEQQAFEFLFEQDASLVHAYLIDRIRILAKEYLDHKDYVNARRAIDVLERMKE